MSGLRHAHLSFAVVGILVTQRENQEQNTTQRGQRDRCGHQFTVFTGCLTTALVEEGQNSCKRDSVVPKQPRSKGPSS